MHSKEGNTLTEAVSGQMATSQPAHPWWGTGTCAHTHFMTNSVENSSNFQPKPYLPVFEALKFHKIHLYLESSRYDQLAQQGHFLFISAPLKEISAF